MATPQPHTIGTPETQAAAVAAEAHAIVVVALEGFGNNLSQPHRAALAELTAGLARLAFGLDTGRRAFPLPCGMGKTQAVVALCAALHRLGHHDRSVAVAASKVEALCEMKRCMIAAGIPAEQIGLLHSYKHDPEKALAGIDGYASEPTTPDTEQRQFSLCTHNRIRGGAALARFYQHHGRPRSLLVWDESLLTANAAALSFIDLESALGWASPQLRLKAHGEALDYLQETLAAIGAELDRQKAVEGAPVEPRPVTTREIDGATVGRFKEALGGSAIVQPLKDLLEMAAGPLRCVWTPHKGGAGLVTYDLAVPAALGTVAVLDASYPIRELERLDRSIRPGMAVPADIKRHDMVTLHHMQAPSGRGAMTKDFTSDRLVVAEAVEVIKGIPATEAVIVWTFKPRTQYDLGRRKAKVDFAGILKAALVDAGIDIEAKTAEGKPRFVWLTWGNETSTSHHSYCSHMVFAGILHRNLLDLAASLVGQRDDLWAAVDHAELRRILHSEVAHSVYQALCRGSCRQVEAGQAKPMAAWLMHADDGSLKRALQEVMPGMVWAEWSPRFIQRGAEESPRQQLKRCIGDHLDGLGAGIRQISVQALRRGMGLTPDSSTFSRALTEFLAASFLWTKQGRTLIRLAQPT